MQTQVNSYGTGLIVTVVLACLGSATASADRAPVPLKGSYSGYASLEEDFTGAHCMGAGNFLHLGLVSTQCDAVFLSYGEEPECTGVGTGLGIPNVGERAAHSSSSAFLSGFALVSGASRRMPDCGVVPIP